MDATEPGEGSVLGEISRWLTAGRAGDPEAANRLFELAYPDLRRVAARHLRGQRDGGPSPTSLVHEAFVRMAGRGRFSANDRRHFFALLSRAMRQIVIDAARRRSAGKRGGGQVATGFDDVVVLVPATGSPAEELLSLDNALRELEEGQPEMARTVELHFFGGLTFGEIGEAYGVSERTVQREWRAARALLHDHLTRGEPVLESSPGRAP